MTTSNPTRLPAALAATSTLLLALAAAHVAQAADAPAGAIASATDPALPTPRVINGESPATAANILAARRYAAFWNTGKPEYARAALASNFTDRTLPAGRPQGPNGPIEASKNFRAAVPDLRAELEEVVAAGDRVVVRLHFTGTFTGKMGKVQGKGTKVDFQAMDLYRVVDGKITDNWHLEDINLFKQLGMVQEAK